MKKHYTYFCLLFVLSLFTNAQDYTITHNIGTSLSNGYGCFGADNYMARHFDLSSLGVAGAIDIESIDLGIFQNDQEQTITVNIYEVDGSFPTGFNWDASSLLGSEDFTLDAINVGNSNFTAEMRNFVFTTPINIPSSVTHIMVEYVTNDLINFQPAVGVGNGETGYLYTLGCGGLPGYTASVDLFGANQEYFISLNAYDAALPPADYTITYNLTTSLSQAQTFLCGPNDRIARHFAMSDFGIAGPVELATIDLGIFQLDQDQNVTVTIYEADGAFPAGFDSSTAPVLGTEDFLMTAVNPGNINFAAEMRSFDFTTPIVVPDTVSHIVVEYLVPGDDGLGGIVNFLPAAAVGTGQSGYYGTDGCGGPIPLTATVDLFGINYEYFISLNAYDTTIDPPTPDYTITYNLTTSLSQAQTFLCGPNDRIARHFAMSDFGITGPIELMTIDLGIFQLDQDQNITVTVYEADGAFPAGFDSSTAPVLGTEDFLMTAVNPGNVNFAAEMRSFDFTSPIVVPNAVSHIVVEYLVPGDDGLGGIVNFLPAAAVGTGQPGYYGTDGCGGPIPLTATVELFGINYEYFISLNALDTTLSNNDFELVDNELVIYPNPASDIVNIKTSSSSQVVSIEVYDILGKLQGASSGLNQIDVSSLSEGIYILQVETNFGKISKRIVKK
ncbi:T9SS type A sorting domain-containing protein [Pontimicrobium sp. IMCC45349]|uniref:T9SS type A sorting domain-containing protein n=1 Tax=Pontimicrobium sp. IMCC45349 TaxID=3391574 RepID=UPI00399FC5F3